MNNIVQRVITIFVVLEFVLQEIIYYDTTIKSHYNTRSQKYSHNILSKLNLTTNANMVMLMLHSMYYVEENIHSPFTHIYMGWKMDLRDV